MAVLSGKITVTLKEELMWRTLLLSIVPRKTVASNVWNGSDAPILPGTGSASLKRHLLQRTLFTLIPLFAENLRKFQSQVKSIFKMQYFCSQINNVLFILFGFKNISNLWKINAYCLKQNYNLSALYIKIIVVVFLIL